MPRSKPVVNRRRRATARRSIEANHVVGRALEASLRDTGIRIIGAVPWGTHFSVFYETPQDLQDIAATYFGPGLQNNEYCLWVVSEPLTVHDAENFLRGNLANFDEYLAHGSIEIVAGDEWYLNGGQFDSGAIARKWDEKLKKALAKGYEGMRATGNALWLQTHFWKEFCAYELDLGASVANRKMIVMCTYSLLSSRAIDVMDVARAHQLTVARRNGDWEFLETPELRHARREISLLRGGLDILSKPFPGHERVTPRERVVLAQIVRGASSKEAARALDVSPRTIEFHRANIMQKLGAKNVVDLLTLVLGKTEDQ